MSRYAARAYGMVWTAPTFPALVRKIDAYGERHNLRAVSIVAKEI